MIEDGAIHSWFGLTYANYLVLPRSVLQSMPGEWQQRFVDLLEEADRACRRAGVEMPDYRVQAVDSRGRFMRDPIPHYNRGRTRIDALDPKPPSGPKIANRTVFVSWDNLGYYRWFCSCGKRHGGYSDEQKCRADGLDHQQSHT